MAKSRNAATKEPRRRAKSAGRKNGAAQSGNGANLGGRGKIMRNRQHETLFIDARKLGTMIDRVHREMTDDDIAKIADTYHRWRGDGDASAGAQFIAPSKETWLR